MRKEKDFALITNSLGMVKVHTQLKCNRMNTSNEGRKEMNEMWLRRLSTRVILFVF